MKIGSKAMALVPLLLLTLAGPTTHARELPTAKPERLGVSGERLQRISELMQRYVDDGRVAGIHTVVARGGRIVFDEVQGQRGFDDAAPLGADALYRIYSMTKPITAVAAMQLYEQGLFHLNDPVSKFVPELETLTVLSEDGERVPAASAVTMHQLLTHTAGFSYGFDPNDPVDKLYRDAAVLGVKDLDEFAVKLAELPLKHQPGTHWHYSVAVDVTGLVVQRLSGMPFDEYLQKNIFEPLGMTDTFFSVPDDKLERFLPNHMWNPEAGKPVTMGEQALESFRNVTLHSGGGGLVSTMADYLKFAEMLRNGGTYNGARLLGPKTIRYMVQDHLPAVIAGASGGAGAGELPGLRGFRGFGFGLGFGVVTDAEASAVLSSAGEYSWGGAAGTIFWIDPTEDLVVVSMIQLMRSPWPLRSDLKVAVNQALLQAMD